MNDSIIDIVRSAADDFLCNEGIYPDAVHLSNNQIMKMKSEVARWYATIPSGDFPTSFDGMKIILSPNDGPHFVSYE